LLWCFWCHAYTYRYQQLQCLWSLLLFDIVDVVVVVVVVVVRKRPVAMHFIWKIGTQTQSHTRNINKYVQGCIKKIIHSREKM
jgi:hypothetical protein